MFHRRSSMSVVHFFSLPNSTTCSLTCAEPPLLPMSSHVDRIHRQVDARSSSSEPGDFPGQSERTNEQQTHREDERERRGASPSRACIRSRHGDVRCLLRACVERERDSRSYQIFLIFAFHHTSSSVGLDRKLPMRPSIGRSPSNLQQNTSRGKISDETTYK
jgi:hypothetical protein